MVLSDRTIREEIESGRIVIDPFEASNVQPSSVDVRVDRQFRVFHNARYPYIDVRQPMDDLTELVYPIHWEEAGPENWRVSLRCPNCEWNVTGIFTQDVVDDFDERLDEGTEQVVSDLKQLMHANMSEEIERFVAALEAEALLPEDF